MPVQRHRLNTDPSHAPTRRFVCAVGGSLIVLCLLLAATQVARTTPALLQPTIVSLAALDDPQGTGTIAWAMDQEQAGRFTTLPAKAFTAPGAAVHWLRLVVSVPPGVDSSDWTLDLNWPFLRCRDWHIPGYAAFIARTHGEYNLYLSAPLALPPGLTGDATVYVRLAGYGSVNINPVITPALDAQVQTALRPWVLGFFFGTMGSMLAYNLFLFLSLRDASYGYYVANVALLILYYAFSTGIIDGLIPANSRDAHGLLLQGFHGVAALLFANMGLFTRSFLLTRSASPGIDRILIGQILLASLLVPMGLFFSSDASLLFGPPVGMLTAAVILLAAVVRWRQGFRPAAIFAVGWGFYVLCGATHSMTWAGLLPATPITIHAPMLGTVVEIFVMSLALVYRVKLLREHAQLAETERCRLSLEKARSDAAREDLARENTLLAMILDDHRFGIGVVRDGRFQFANRQLARHFGCETLAGQILAEVPHALRFLGNTAATPPLDRDSEREMVIGDNGSGRSLRAVGRLLDPARPDQGTVYIVEDVSEARRLEKLKNDIDQVMRHDLKSPLATIAGIQEALELAGPLTERQRSLTGMLERTVAAMTSRLNLSLYLYKIEAGSLHLTPQPLLLARLLEEARLELALFLTAGNRLDIVYEVPPGTFTVLGERVLFVSLWVNLLRNALEAAKGLGPVVVTVSTPDAPRVAITNPGEVPAGIRDRFFEKYVTAGKSGGTGLGTYSARLIARTFGGDITLDASRPGYTTVTVTGLRPG